MSYPQSKARVIGLTRPLDDATVTAGETATFQCELSYEGIAVEWFLGDRKLEPGDRVSDPLPVLVQGLRTQCSGSYKGLLGSCTRSWFSEAFVPRWRFCRLFLTSAGGGVCGAGGSSTCVTCSSVSLIIRWNRRTVSSKSRDFNVTNVK